MQSAQIRSHTGHLVSTYTAEDVFKFDEACSH